MYLLFITVTDLTCTQMYHGYTPRLLLMLYYPCMYICYHCNHTLCSAIYATHVLKLKKNYVEWVICEGEFFHELTNSNFLRRNFHKLSRAFSDLMFLFNISRVKFSQMAIDSWNFLKIFTLKITCYMVLAKIQDTVKHTHTQCIYTKSYFSNHT